MWNHHIYIYIYELKEVEDCCKVVAVFCWYRRVSAVPENHMDVYINMISYRWNHHIVGKNTYFIRYPILHFKTQHCIVDPNHIRDFFFQPCITGKEEPALFQFPKCTRKFWGLHFEISGPQLIVSSPRGPVVFPLGPFVPRAAKNQQLMTCRLKED